MEFLKYIIIIIVGYLMGNIQSSYIIGKLNNIDIREHGSKNAGASNVVMTLGWKKGVLTGVLDILKAAVPVFIVTLVFPDNDLLSMTCGAAVVLGHIFPVFLGFKGGKGTASIVGIALGLNPFIFLIIGLVIVILTIVTDYIAIGTLVMLVSFILCLIFYDYSIAVISLFTATALLNMYLHIPNFKSIRNGTESGLRDALKKD